MNIEFRQRRVKAGLTLREVADEAKLSIGLVYVFEIGGVVNEDVKRKSNQALTELIKQPVEDQPTTEMRGI